MNADIKLGRIAGIPIGLNSSWFLIFGILSLSLATGLFPMALPGLATPIYWLLGALTALLFFGSVLLHELGHAVVAIRGGLNVRGITLFMFGGVAELERDSRSAGEEFRVAIAGPLVSFALAVIFGGLVGLTGETAFGLMAAYLAQINLSLALFNLIPGYPLDGGRVLKAITWHVTGSPDRATRIAGASGRLVAWGFLGFGIWTILTGSFFNGLWFVLIGWFLQNAATSSVQQSQFQRILDGTRARDAMTGTRSWVYEWTPLQSVIEDALMRPQEQHAYLVRSSDEAFTGLLTSREIAAVPPRNRPFTSARQAMRPWSHVPQIGAEAGLLDALQTMERQQIEQMAVTEGGSVVGLLTREGIVRFLRARQAGWV